MTEIELKLYEQKYGGYVQPLVDEIRRLQREVERLKKKQYQQPKLPTSTA
jgi:FtsZ-binding cell division protein ZapB